MGMGGCCFSEGATPGSILLFWAVDIRLVSVSWSGVGLVERSGVIVGLSGCGSAFGFRFRGCFGLRVAGGGRPGPFCGGWGFWGLGAGALVVSECK